MVVDRNCVSDKTVARNFVSNNLCRVIVILAALTIPVISIGNHTHLSAIKRIIVLVTVE